MRAYDTRGIVLDAGLAALTLRALHEPDGHYPFLDRVMRRGPSVFRRRRLASAGPSASRRDSIVRWIRMKSRVLTPA
jgi:hypothetical protein